VEDPIDDLLDVLDLTELGPSSFNGQSSGHGDYGLFGGHQLAQAIIGACKSVADERLLHSIHAFFLRGGDGHADIRYDVQSVREGRAFCQRRVTGIQQEKQIIDLTASFHLPEQGPTEIIPEAPRGNEPPSGLPTFEECIEEVGPIFGEEWSQGLRPVEYRIEHAPWSPSGPSPQGGINFWFRSRKDLPADPNIHSAILAYMSDDCLCDTLLVPYGRTWGSEGTMLVSLDHSMWFHAEAKADRWIYVEQWPVTSAGARGLAQGRMWQDGKLVASMSQEALVRF
tara:strand:- start:1013 stop:1861 length:849 start_codon:yes stop_codon:yes gene_type:complete